MGRGREAGLRVLVADVVLLAGAAFARVAVDWAGGAWWPRGDLAVDFLPKLVWWWSRPRLLGGWNPWIYAGFPANADPQIGQLHPFGLLYALLPPLVAQGAENVLVPLAAMLGMRAWLGGLGCTRLGALVGALSYGLGGF